MAADVQGMQDLRAKLREIPQAMRRRVLRNALAAGGRLVRNEARRRAPVLKVPTRYRATGTLRKAISVRTSKDARKQGNVGVFVNVRPAKAGQRGAKSRNDPFYWFFLYRGTKKLQRRDFLTPAGAKLREALSIFEREVVRWVDKINANGSVK